LVAVAIVDRVVDSGEKRRLAERRAPLRLQAAWALFRLIKPIFDEAYGALGRREIDHTKIHTLSEVWREYRGLDLSADEDGKMSTAVAESSALLRDFRLVFAELLDESETADLYSFQYALEPPHEISPKSWEPVAALLRRLDMLEIPERDRLLGTGGHKRSRRSARARPDDAR
jgi:hypothetical protein